uniref:Peroxisomal membrane protein PEX16 n=1 Tax=Physcomitrium patens TaxID=3218 RepID=A0A7I4FDP0_PHYPA
MEAYKEWVRRNRLWLSSIESLANTMTWFLPERLTSSELAPEALSTMVGLVTVMNEHIVATAPEISSTEFQVRPPEDPTFPWPLLLSVVKEVEVLVEMSSEHFLGRDQKWTPVAVVEALKAFMRLLVLHKSGYKMLIDGGETLNREEKPESSHCDVLGKSQIRGATPSSSNQPRAIQAMNKYRNNVGTRPSWLVAKPVATPPPPPPTQHFEPKSSAPIRKFKILGEVLLILRPFLYVMMIRRHGLRSWRPWLSALAIDATGMAILYGSTLFPDYVFGNKSIPRCVPSKQEKNEITRRQVLWALYLMRSPFFDLYTHRRLERVEKTLKPVPLFGSLAGKAVELIQELSSAC